MQRHLFLRDVTGTSRLEAMVEIFWELKNGSLFCQGAFTVLMAINTGV